VWCIVICRLLEALNFGLIARWLNNIKMDLMKFIRLVRQRNVYLSTDDSTGQVEIKAKVGEIIGD